MHRAVPALIVPLLLFAAPAGARQTWAVMAKMGAAGTWAGDCKAGPSTGNWFITHYADAKGQARRKAVRGDGGVDLNSTIDSTQFLTPTTFLMRIRNDDVEWGDNNGMTYDTAIEINSRGMHTLASTRVGDGKFVSNDHPTTVFQRCR